MTVLLSKYFKGYILTGSNFYFAFFLSLSKISQTNIDILTFQNNKG